MASNVFLKASVPLSTKSLLSLVKFAFSCRSTEVANSARVYCNIKDILDKFHLSEVILVSFALANGWGRGSYNLWHSINTNIRPSLE